MKITFIGATHEVTGSCYYLEAAGKRFLVDYGMEQGPNYYENQEIPVAPGELDFVLLTHAHMDHAECCLHYMQKAFRDRSMQQKPPVICVILCFVIVHISRCLRQNGAIVRDAAREKQICACIYHGRCTGSA